MFAIPSTPVSRNSSIRPAAWTNSSSAWPKRRPPRPLRRPRRQRNSVAPLYPPARPTRCTGGLLFPRQTDYQQRQRRMDLKPQIEKFARRFAEVESALSDPKAFDNPQRAQELSREYARLKELVANGQ